jgi:hypothetical protein
LAGVLATISELLSCEAVSSACSWPTTLWWGGEETVAWKENYHSVGVATMLGQST